MNLEDEIVSDFLEVDSQIIVALMQENEEYAQIIENMKQLLVGNPRLYRLLDEDIPTALSKEDTAILLSYRDLQYRAENIERQALYFRGYKDCILYLKKVGWNL